MYNLNDLRTMDKFLSSVFNTIDYSIDNTIKPNTFDFTEWMKDYDSKIKKTSSKGYLKTDIKSNDKGSKITIKEPGINKENTEISVEDLGAYFMMSITALDKETKIKLSKLLNIKKIKAECKDGILVIDVPKKKENIVNVNIE